MCLMQVGNLVLHKLPSLKTSDESEKNWYKKFERIYQKKKWNLDFDDWVLLVQQAVGWKGKVIVDVQLAVYAYVFVCYNF